MNTIYISKYKKDGNVVDTPFCIYDKRSPAEDIIALDPKCNLEDSRAGSLSITLPQTHVAYDYIIKDVTTISMYRLDRGSNPSDPLNLTEKLIFEGPIRSINKTFNNDKTLYAEGFFSYLNETVQPSKEYFDITLEDYLKALIAVHNEKMVNEPGKQFTIGTVDITFPDTDAKGHNVSEFEGTQFGTTMEYFLNIQERYGGHYIFSKTNGSYRIDYVRNLPKNEGQSINFGENLLDFVVDDDATDICTAVVPISALSKTSLGTVGEVIVSTDVSRIPSKYHIDEHMTDESNRQCWGVYEHWGQTDQRLLAYIYDRRGLKQKDNDNTRGAYDIGDFGGSGYHLVRYFVSDEFERLYLSSRADTGGFNGFWCYYAYNHTTDLLDYQELDRNEGSDHPNLWNSIHDLEIDLSYTSAGAKHYTDRSNNTVGELLIRGFGSGIPTEIKAPKYSYAEDPEVGDILLTYGYCAPGFTGFISYHCCLYRNSDDDDIYYFDLQSVVQDSPMCIVELEIPPEGSPLRDFDAIMITTRTALEKPGEGYENLTGDCLYALYYGSSPMYMLGYERINENDKFTSVINYKIDLKAAENVGADRIMVMCYGLRENNGQAPIVPVIRKVKRYADKLTNYLTAESAYPDYYHDAGSLVVSDPNLIAKYGYSEKRLEFSGIEDPNVLVKRAEAYLVDTQWGNMEMNARGVDLHDFDFDIEAFDISTSVNVVSAPHGLNQYFEVKSLTLNPDNPDLNEITLTEENEGYFNGTLPCSILTASDELRELKLYGTPAGIITPGAQSINDIYITLHNLVTDHEWTIHVERDSPLQYPDYIYLGTDGVYEGFESGLIEITTTSMDNDSGEYPTIEFRYDKVRDGNN